MDMVIPLMWVQIIYAWFKNKRSKTLPLLTNSQTGLINSR